MIKKPKLAQKIFQTEAHMQGGKKVPIPEKKEYGTGATFKKPTAKKRTMR